MIPKMANVRYGAMLLLKTKVLLLWLLFGLQLNAQLGGSGTYSFLKLPPSARVEALGGTNVSIFDNDPAMAFEAPSLLNEAMHNQATVDFNSYFAGIGYGTVGYARSYAGIGNFFAGIQYVHYGTFTAANEQGEKTGTFSASDQAIYLGYSRPFFDSLLYLGGNFKAIFSQYESYASAGLALDLSATYQSKNKRTHTTLTFSHIGTMLDPYTSGTYESLPFEINLGFAHELEHLPLRLMVNATNLQRPDLSYVDPDNRFTIDPLTNDTTENRIGFGENFIRHFIIAAELMPFKKHVFLRVGYNFLRGGELSVEQAGGATGLSFGLGIRISHFTFSYSRANYHPAGSPNHFSLQVNMGALFGPKTQKPVDN